MKATTTLLTIASILTAGMLAATAAEPARPGGPKGGRLLEKTEPAAEFFMETDRTVTITFYDSAMKPIAAAEQSVKVIADAESGKQSLEFEKKGDVLASTTPLPEGEGYPIVVLFRQTPEDKPQNFRFALELHTCGGCQRVEYACTCDE